MRTQLCHALIVVSLGLIAQTAAADAWKVGIAAVSITPTEPVHLIGYSNRAQPFESVETEIYAKALVVEDGGGNRGLIITSDLVGFQDAYAADICRQIAKKTGLERRQIILSSSHNHTGPLISLDPVKRGNLAHGDLTDAEAQRTIEYSRALQGKVVQIAVDAVADLKPADISWGETSVDFMMNRRVGEPGAISMAPNASGVVDRIVPVMKVTSPDGTLRCVLFGCACHNTTLTPDHNFISGDYAGHAQQILERKYPNVQAMFISGCGADANPEPRGSLDQSRLHGAELATAVGQVIDSQTTELKGPLQTAYELADLPLASFTRDELQKYLPRGDGQAMMAAHMIEVLERDGRLIETYAAPVAVWRFGNSLTLVALPGEGVAGYVDLIRKRLPTENLWVSSYNNDCFGYLPTAQIVREGGHEAIGVTVWLWGNHLADRTGFFDEGVEQTILDAVAKLFEQLNSSSDRASTTQ